MTYLSKIRSFLIHKLIIDEKADLAFNAESFQEGKIESSSFGNLPIQVSGLAPDTVFGQARVELSL